jgi:DNA-binding response OmpR family regulator
MRMGLEDNLSYEGYRIDSAADGHTGLSKIREQAYDLLILDVMLPGTSGFDICKTIRKEGIRTPVIMLTARGEEIDKVLGLELGADDYITKPFGIRELLARIKAVLRRDQFQEKKSDRMRIGRLLVDFTSYVATEKGDNIKMSHKEFEILKYLSEHPNQTVSRFDMLEHIWGYEDEQPTTRTVDNFIVKLRQKIEPDSRDPSVILTVHGIGYKMII